MHNRNPRDMEEESSGQLDAKSPIASAIERDNAPRSAIEARNAIETIVMHSNKFSITLERMWCCGVASREID
jgi:hypothetical protein